MKIKADRKKLLAAISMAAGAAPAKSALPILNNLLLEASDGVVEITGTDLEVGIRAKAEVDVLEAGRVTIEASFLKELVGSAVADEVTIEADEVKKTATIMAGKTCLNARTLPADEYPQLPTHGDCNTFRVEAGQLARSLKLVMFSWGADASRPIMLCVYFEVKEGSLKMVTTDSHRLTWNRMDITGEGTYTANVASAGIKELVRALPEEGEVTVKLTGSQVFFEWDNTVLQCRQIEGQFPNYERIIPDEAAYNHVVTTGREMLVSALKRATILDEIRLKMTTDPMGIGFTVESGSNKFDDWQAAQVEGSQLQQFVNVKYMLQVVSTMDSDTIRLQMQDGVKPMKITMVDSDDFGHILMPIQGD